MPSPQLQLRPRRPLPKSPALKRMLAKARLIIISELRFALNLDEEEAVKRLDRALPKVEIPEEE